MVLYVFETFCRIITVDTRGNYEQRNLVTNFFMKRIVFMLQI